MLSCDFLSALVCIVVAKRRVVIVPALCHILLYLALRLSRCCLRFYNEQKLSCSCDWSTADSIHTELAWGLFCWRKRRSPFTVAWLPTYSLVASGVFCKAFHRHGTTGLWRIRQTSVDVDRRDRRIYCKSAATKNWRRGQKPNCNWLSKYLIDWHLTEHWLLSQLFDRVHQQQTHVMLNLFILKRARNPESKVGRWRLAMNYKTKRLASCSRCKR